ncbi:TetR/AcrR family transcriptional regulator [Paraburkholderia sp. J76]|uniref:TetR/AcrR family transcriptional regulator n=1 Tax=Paraburkholderia sp. J76 TaxID=2805439 RepID=UPI002ABE8B83|nr:TetR/AcrR family transcriptional regulator [Paraburkholderia sp. J76]
MKNVPPPLSDDVADDARSRILAAAAALIAEGGSEAATTRAIAAAASVQAPTLYRMFGDKNGLLKAVAEKTLADYVASKARKKPASDPVEELRVAWDTHIAFGLAHPAIFGLMAAPQSPEMVEASAAGHEVLRQRIRCIARAGRLRVSEERAVDLIRATGTGVTLTLLQMPPSERKGVSEAARDAVFAAILSDPVQPSPTGLVAVASTLRASLDDVPDLSPGERLLLAELLHRIAQAK